MWRKIRREDMQKGLVVRLTNLSDTPFNGCVVLEHNSTRVPNDHVRLARPQAYASQGISRQPLLYAEVFEMSLQSLCATNTDAEVWEGKYGLLTMLT